MGPTAERGGPCGRPYQTRFSFRQVSKSILERVQDEVVALVEAAIAWVRVVPTLVVNRDAHLWRIAVVQAVAAAEVFLSPEVLGIVNIGVVIEPIPITEVSLAPPTASKSALISRSRFSHGHVAA